MAPKEVALHTQDLVDVMVELDHCKDDPRFAKAFEMVNHGSVYQLNENDLEDHRGVIFGNEAWDSPILSGKDDLPFTSLPTPAQTQRIMQLEIGGSNDYTFAPSHGTPDLDAHATKALLANILNPSYTTRGAIIHAACPTLDRLRKDTPARQHDAILGQTNFQITIAPAREFFDLKLYPTHRCTTLLAGTHVILAYPPSPSNSAALTTRFEALSGRTTGPIWPALTLQHGIAIVQNPGETLALPPFWSSVVFSTQTSVSAEYSLATASTYTLRFEHIRLFTAQLGMWPAPSATQVELVNFAAALASHLSLCLNAHVPRFDNKAVTSDICRKWDVQMKGAFGRLLGMIEDEDECARICGGVEQAWVVLVHGKREKKPICRLCKERLEKVKGVRGPDREMVEHVRTRHCVVRGGEGAVKEEEDVDAEGEAEEMAAQYAVFGAAMKGPQS